MPPPNQLSIATSSVQRLVKEEASYHKELEKQQARLKNLEDNPDGDENAEFQLRQEARTLISHIHPCPPIFSFNPRPPSLPPILPFPSPSSLSLCPSFTPPPTLSHPLLPPRFSKKSPTNVLLPLQKAAIAETLAVFPPLRQRIADAVQDLEDRLSGQENGDSTVPDEEIARAKEVVAAAKKVLEEGGEGK